MSAPPQTSSPPCCLCGGAEFSTVLSGVRDHVWRKPGVFTLQRCARCGLVATRPRPAGPALSFYYEDTYSGEGSPIDAEGFYDSALGRLLLDYRLATLAKAHPLGPGDRLLDVGCSHGSLPAHARRKTGCTAGGLDIDAGSIENALDADVIDYRVGRLPDVDYPAEAFTVVTFFESLEHEEAPLDTLRAAYRVLEPGGACLVEVPNYRSLWRVVFGSSWLPLLVPQHVSHFTPATLRLALEQSGFEVVHAQSMLFPLELVASLGIVLGRAFGPPQGDRAGPGRKLYEKSAGVLLFVLWWVAELPTQIALRLLGFSGHQAMVGRKPTPPAPAP